MVSRGVKQPTRLLSCILRPGMDKAYSAVTTEKSNFHIAREVNCAFAALVVYFSNNNVSTNFYKYSIYYCTYRKFVETLLCEKYTASAAMHLDYIK